MQLFYHPLSGHSHRVRLFLSLLNEPVDLVEVGIAGGQNKTEDFLKLNRFDQVPVLRDADVVVADSNAIMIYLAKKLGRTEWLPEDPIEAASVQSWLSVSSGELACGIATARRIHLFGSNPIPLDVVLRSRALLDVLDVELEKRDWLAGKPTLADVSFYAYVARAPEGGIDLTDYPTSSRGSAGLKLFLASCRSPSHQFRRDRNARKRRERTTR